MIRLMFKYVLVGLFLAFLIGSYSFEKNNGEFWFTFLIVSFTTAFTTVFLAFFDKQFGKLTITAASTTFFLIVLFFAMISFSEMQYKSSKKKGEQIITYIKDYRKQKGIYPASLDAIPKRITIAWIGVFPKPLNVYAYTDTTFEVGWVYKRRMVYESKDDSWFSNLESKF